MNAKDQVVFQKILKYIIKINSYTSALNFVGFERDSVTVDAVAFGLGQIAELARRISGDVQVNNPHIDWKGIRGLRNHIIHDYDNVDLHTVWETVRSDLPILEQQILELLERE